MRGGFGRRRLKGLGGLWIGFEGRGKEKKEALLLVERR